MFLTNKEIFDRVAASGCARIFYARRGREIRKIFDARFDAKGWKPQKAIERTRLKLDGTILTKKPGAAEDRFYLELKPNTPSGRSLGARQIRKYLEANEQAKRGRVLYYDPKDFYP